MKIDIALISLNESGQVVLGDDDLAQIAETATLAGGNDSTNGGSCSNAQSCQGDTNTGRCTNASGQCAGSINRTRCVIQMETT